MISKKLKRRECFLFYKARITLIPNPDEENYRPISLMNTDTKILNKVLAQQIQHLKKLIYHTKWYLPQGCKDGSTSTNQSVGYTTLPKWRTKPYDYLNRCRKAFDTIHHPFMMATLNKVGTKGTHLSILKSTCDKRTANIILDGEETKAGTKASWSSLVA